MYMSHVHPYGYSCVFFYGSITHTCRLFKTQGTKAYHLPKKQGHRGIFYKLTVTVCFTMRSHTLLVSPPPHTSRGLSADIPGGVPHELESL